MPGIWPAHSLLRDHLGKSVYNAEKYTMRAVPAVDSADNRMMFGHQHRADCLTSRRARQAQANSIAGTRPRL